MPSLRGLASMCLSFRLPLVAVVLWLGAGFAASGMACAQVAQPCDWRASAENLAEPWDRNSRTFANGAIRIAVLDTAEPAAAAFYLLILSPPADELGLRQCRVLSRTEQTGFGGLSLDGAVAGYDPARGLTVALPAVNYGDDGLPLPATLRVMINQATGLITGRLD